MLAGVLGNAGTITAADAQKGAHFIQLCDMRSVGTGSVKVNFFKRFESFESLRDGLLFFK